MIKRVFIFVFVLSIVSAVPLFAGEMKNYSDWINGYSGTSGAEYMGTTTEIDLEKLIMNGRQSFKQKAQYIGDCKKLTKEENFLLWSALNEFDYKDNEIYAVGIFWDHNTESAFLGLIAVITENGKSFNWYSVGYFHGW